MGRIVQVGFGENNMFFQFFKYFPKFLKRAILEQYILALQQRILKTLWKDETDRT